MNNKGIVIAKGNAELDRLGNALAVASGGCELGDFKWEITWADGTVAILFEKWGGVFDKFGNFKCKLDPKWAHSQVLPSLDPNNK